MLGLYLSCHGEPCHPGSDLTPALLSSVPFEHLTVWAGFLQASCYPVILQMGMLPWFHLLIQVSEKPLAVEAPTEPQLVSMRKAVTSAG